MLFQSIQPVPDYLKSRYNNNNNNNSNNDDDDDDDKSQEWLFEVDGTKTLVRNNAYKHIRCSIPILDFTDWGIEYLHDDVFSGCNNLTRLTLNVNSLSVLNNNTLSPLKKKLKGLYIENNHLHQFPINITVLTALEELSLGYNSITNIESQYFDNFSNLLILTLSCNPLQSQFIQNLIPLSNSLRALLAMRVGLNKIPDDLCKLEKLTFLYMGYNNISEIQTNDFMHCNSITTLELSHNSITLISDKAFSHFPNLDMLYLHGNKLSNLPDALKSVNSLRALEFSHNHIGIINNGDFKKLSSLTFLSLANTSLTTIEKDAFNSVNNTLSSLILQDNYFTKIPLPISNLKNLGLLLFNQNQISKIESNSFKNLKKLSFLHFADNFISIVEKDSFLPESNPVLRFLGFENNSLQEIPRDIKRLKSLKILYFDNNNITNIQPDSLKFCEKLNILSFSNNQISIINEEVFENTKNLQVLYLNSNNISSSILTNKTLYHLHNSLLELNLSSNKINTIPSTIMTFKKLAQLEFADNQISSVESNMLYYLRRQFVKKNITITTYFATNNFMMDESVIINTIAIYTKSFLGIQDNLIPCCSKTGEELLRMGFFSLIDPKTHGDFIPFSCLDLGNNQVYIKDVKQFELLYFEMGYSCKSIVQKRLDCYDKLPPKTYQFNEVNFTCSSLKVACESGHPEMKFNNKVVGKAEGECIDIVQASLDCENSTHYYDNSTFFCLTKFEVQPRQSNKKILIGVGVTILVIVVVSVVLLARFIIRRKKYNKKGQLLVDGLTINEFLNGGSVGIEVKSDLEYLNEQSLQTSISDFRVNSCVGEVDRVQYMNDEAAILYNGSMKNYFNLH